MEKKYYIKKSLKFAFSGFSLFFIGMLLFPSNSYFIMYKVSDILLKS